MRKQIIIAFLLSCVFIPSAFAGIKQDLGNNVTAELGFWGQAWMQVYETPAEDTHTDFIFRRAYFYARSQVTPKASLFLIIAADRLGQEGLNDSSNGLGSGIAVREAWFAYSFSDEFKLQAGRMYIPFTRNFGTTMPMTLMTTDLNFTQGGIRGNIFYPSRVARDDGVTAWGNLQQGLFQYRFMIADGSEDPAAEDNFRTAGRIAFNLGEDKETTWTNKGTYLGEKRIFAVGAGFDQQSDLISGDYSAWTIDAFLDRPMGSGALTVEAGFTGIKNGPVAPSFSAFTPGDDASIGYVTAGYLFSGKKFQPYFRVERLSIDNKEDTTYTAAGFNYFIKGHEAKFSVDWTHLSDSSDQNFLTLQYTLGF